MQNPHPMQYFHPLPVALFPPRASQVFLFSLAGGLLSIPLVVMPSLAPRLAEVAGYLQPIFGVLILVSAARVLVSEIQTWPLWGRVDRLSYDTIQSRLDAAAEESAVYLAGRIPPSAGVRVHLRTEMDGISLSVLVGPVQIATSPAFLAKLARQIAPDGTDARAIFKPISHALRGGASYVSATVRPADLSAHQRLAHLRRVETADGPGPASQGTFVPEKEIA